MLKKLQFWFLLGASCCPSMGMLCVSGMGFMSRFYGQRHATGHNEISTRTRKGKSVRFYET
jgi:hypothetical protein